MVDRSFTGFDFLVQRRDTTRYLMRQCPPADDDVGCLFGAAGEMFRRAQSTASDWLPGLWWRLGRTH